MAGLLMSCGSGKKVYISTCDANMVFKQVTYTHLMDSLSYYNNKYVEIVGKYQEGKEESALFSDSLYMAKPNTALWVNFSQDCPLYLTGTHTGFFQYDDGGYTHINNKKIRIRGRLDLHNRGYQKQYKGCIDHVSFIEL
ncbi:hypothetical protein [Mucilaginibacter sp. dw_454]|uniref:hypothetical protein n=1 Tax=Mucilaginibacter sp. dw_454 TaxID=2720079 RepID=UPI001BD4B685|nr:hypothetical protein [Mucilaginibacter sp. dw_454]